MEKTPKESDCRPDFPAPRVSMLVHEHCLHGFYHGVYEKHKPN